MQLADLAERYLEQKAEGGRGRKPRQIRIPRQYEPRIGARPSTPSFGFAEVIGKWRLRSRWVTANYGEYCHDIRSSGEYLLSAVINDILDMSRIEAGRIKLEKQDIAVDDVDRARIAHDRRTRPRQGASNSPSRKRPRARRLFRRRARHPAVPLSFNSPAEFRLSSPSRTGRHRTQIAA